MTLPKTTKKTRRQPKVLSQTLYSYCTPSNAQYARTFGKKHFGSFSQYVNALITIDREKHFSKEAFLKPTRKRTAKTTETTTPTAA